MNNVSLVTLGRQVLYDRSLKSIEDAIDFFKAESQKFGQVNLEELRKKHGECSSEDLKYMIELIAGAETLAAQRYQRVLEISREVNYLTGKVPKAPTRSKLFGIDMAKQEFIFHGEGFFKTINMNEIYERWRMSARVNDPEDQKIRRFIRIVVAEVVVDPADANRLTSRSRDDNDHLLRLPNEFKAVLKGFVLHVCGDEDPASELAVSVDHMLTYVVKEIRRNPRKRGRRSTPHDSQDPFSVTFVSPFEEFREADSDRNDKKKMNADQRVIDDKETIHPMG